MKLTDVLVETLICEGVYDPSIFKAIFIIGGIGSGKSYVTDRATKGLGFKLVDPDVPFELLLKRYNVSLKSNDSSDPQWNSLRDRGMHVNDYMLRKYLDGRLGLIITGTGHNYEKLATKKRMLDAAGYDTFMIFVNASLGVTLDRNRKRERSIPDDVVIEKWQHIYQNLAKYKLLLGADNFEIVDTSEGTTQETLDKIWMDIKKFTERPIRNPIAREWIQQQLHNKRQSPFSGDVR